LVAAAMVDETVDWSVGQMFFGEIVEPKLTLFSKHLQSNWKGYHHSFKSTVKRNFQQKKFFKFWQVQCDLKIGKNLPNFLKSCQNIGQGQKCQNTYMKILF
jgi:hypothetical protein